LYTIAKRQCAKWLRQRPTSMQPLDTLPKAELERLFYGQYLEEEQTQALTGALQEVVKHLLQKLPVAERAVIILHYLKGLSCEKVSELLDVSPNTVKSRLYRARKRLEKEELMVREILCPGLLKNIPRHIGVKATAATEAGEHLAQGTFNFSQSDMGLAFIGYGTTGIVYEPAPMYMSMHYITHYPADLYKFPLVIGDTWEQKGHWNSRAEMILGPSETVEVTAGVFRECFRHKTVFTGAKIGTEEAFSEVREANNFINGTRYLWFATGIGFVKMCYEHANGIVTEAELLECEIPGQCEEYFPGRIGTLWTYKWKNNYRDEGVIEKCRVVENSDEPMVYDLSK
ncbi:RNA polymerase sigma factor, partial [Candidatus Poribacteria bacterium]|nr:RNA polymerase sigma factor [Candidatus Poribacteria bacterium]